MWYLNNMVIATPFILFVYVQIVALYFLPPSLLLIHIIVLATTTIFLFLVKWNWSFIFIVGSTLLYGFALTWQAFSEQLLQEQQIEFILMNIVYFVSILSIWHSAHQLQKLKTLLEYEKQKNSRLQKFVNEKSSMLTNKEFTDRVSLSLVGLERRNEMGYLIRISADILKTKEKVYNKILIDVIEDSTRDQFDFFTYIDSSTFLIYLENTNEEGCQVVQSRVLDKLSAKVNTNYLPIEFTTNRVEQLKDTLPYFKVGSFT